MILPMQKVCLVVQNSCRKDALVALRELGVVHIERSGTDSVGLAIAYEHKSFVEEAIGLIESHEPPKKQNSPPAPERIFRPNLTDVILSADNELKLLAVNKAVHLKERERIAPWGDFDSKQLTELAALLGCPLYLYELPSESRDAIPEDIDYIIVSDNGFTLRLFVLNEKIPHAQPFELPDLRLSLIDAELDEIQSQSEAIENRIKSYAAYRAILDTEKAQAEQKIEFEQALADLVKVAELPDEHGVSCLKGFALADDVAKLKKAAQENGWAFIACEPSPDDETPVKLKNNRVVELIRPVMDFFELAPGYYEPDISLWFLLFFTIFFGMIFGDAGYGLILLCISVFAISRSRKTGVPQALLMLCLLSCSNTLWGVLTCSWFGIPVEKLPEFFKNISLSFFSTAKTESHIVEQNLKLFCFSLALIHLSIARISNVLRAIRKRSLKFIAELGSIAMLAGVYNLVLFLVVSTQARPFPLLPVSPWLIGAGFVLALFFSYYEGSIVKSLLGGLSNIMSMLLAISNTFSDIMSYIRLWAVGMAGAAIASMVSSMASPMLVSFLVFLGILVLAFGHGMNMILSVLSVLIHGIRLNILEFSGHAGVSWAGIPYRPFANR